MHIRGFIPETQVRIDCQCCDCLPVERPDTGINVNIFGETRAPHDIPALWDCLLAIPAEDWPRA